jgi:AAA+ ATPase superfamily predicted ATPase
MFGKKPPDPKAALADRVRAIATREAPVVVAKKAARAERKSVFKNATIILDSGTRLAVALKDVSEGGARIEFFEEVLLDDTFIISEPMTRLRRRARVSWRREGIAGLTFVD